MTAVFHSNYYIFAIILRLSEVRIRELCELPLLSDPLGIDVHGLAAKEPCPTIRDYSQMPSPLKGPLSCYMIC